MSTPAWLQTLAKLAPGIASAFGTPLAGMAVSALESVLGVGNGTADKIQAVIENATLTGDQIVQLKKADQDFAAKMKALDIDLAKLQIEDVESARAREIAVKDSTPRVLAYVLIFGFLGTVMGIIFTIILLPDQVAKVPSAAWGLIGTLAGWTLNESVRPLQFYYGTSIGDQNSTSNEMVEKIASLNRQ